MLRVCTFYIIKLIFLFKHGVGLFVYSPTCILIAITYLISYQIGVAYHFIKTKQLLLHIYIKRNTKLLLSSIGLSCMFSILRSIIF